MTLRMKIANAIRAVFLVTALLALATLTVWTAFPDQLKRLDQWVLDRATTPYKKRFDVAADLLNTDPDRARDEMFRLLDDLSQIHKGERLTPTKSNALEALIRHYQQTGAPQKRLKIAQQWIALDDKNLYAQAAYGAALMAIPKRYKEGEAYLLNLQDRYPQAMVVASTLSSGMLNTPGQEVEALWVLTRYMAETASLPTFYNQNWGVSYLGAKNPSGTFKPAAVRTQWPHDGPLTLDVRFPLNTQKLRVTIPRNAWMRMAIPIAHSKNNQHHLPLWDFPLAFENMGQLGRFTLGGMGKQEQYFEWTLPTQLRNAQTISLTTQAFPLPTATLTRLMASNAALHAESILKSQGRPAAAALIVEQRRQLATYQAVTLRWQGEKTGANTTVDQPLLLSQHDGRARFSLRFPIQSSVNELALEWPALMGMEYHFDRIQLITPQAAIPLSTANATTNEQMDPERNAMLITQLPAQIKWSLPNSVAAMGLQVTGWVR